MSSELETAIRLAVQALKSSSAEDGNGRPLDRSPAVPTLESVEAVAACLSSEPALIALAGLCQSGPARRTHDALSPEAIGRSLIMKAWRSSPGEAVSGLRNLASTNCSTAVLTAMVSGIMSDERMQLLPGVHIEPFALSRVSPGVTSIAFRAPGLIVDRLAPEPTAFIDLEFTFEPVFESKTIEEGKWPTEHVDRMIALIDRLSVVVGHSVAIMEMWFTCHGENLPLNPETITFRDPRWDSGPVHSTSAVSHGIPAFLNDFERLQKEGDRRTIDLAARLFNRSQRSTALEVRAIDIGTMLEVLLMHSGQDGSNKGAEITYKISTRTAWALGKSVEERRMIFDEVRTFYRIRSKAVHIGRVKSQDQREEWSKLQRSADLARRMIEQVVASGGFPDWADLVLGGNWPSHRSGG